MEFLQNFFHYPLNELPFVFVAMAVSLSVHEFAHAYSAYLLGDPTAHRKGRVSLNPRKHLDIIGTLLIFLVGFGWAKPVPVNRSNFKNPRLMGIIVSAAGPLSNVLIASATLAVIVALELGGFDPHAGGAHEALTVFLNHLLTLNIVLTVFNLVPLPPLDGYRIIEDVAPLRLRIKMQQNEQWGVFIFLLIVFIPPLRNVTIGPLFTAAYEIAFQMYNWFHSIAA